ATINEESAVQEGGQIEIFDGGTEITDGNTNILDFGIVNIEETLTKTFTVKNASSSETLVLSNFTLPDGFSLEGDFPKTVAPNSEASFTITVDTTKVSNWEGTFSFDTSDTQRNPFDFMIGASISDPSAPVEIIGSNGRDRIQGDDDGIDIITPGGGADIITWRNVPPQGITDEIIGFVPNEDKLQFSKANFGNISSITPVTVTQLLANGTDISGNNFVIFDESLSFTDVTGVDLALAEQNGSMNSPVYFLYGSGGEKYLGYDPIASSAGDATTIAKFDVSPTAESFTFFN
ncbi:MAG TPA: choice-of-anchor D domain-containing protein, partial [Phormidium sp.]